MITEEIQIGNYLRVLPSKQLIKVVGVTEDKIAYMSSENKVEWIGSERVCAVPITPQTLIDNGFEEKETEDCGCDRAFTYKGNECTIHVDFCYFGGDDGINVIQRYVRIFGATCGFDAFFDDVHVLQNVLKHLKLTKKIEVKR